MIPKNLFGGVYKNRKVLVTGHTGFKGSWLTLWLKQLGAEVTGYSAYLPSKPCNFEVVCLKEDINDVRGDVLDIRRLGETFKKYKPQMVFHLAAQPIVRKSYDDPKKTFDTNVGGTVNVLECIRRTPSVKAAVIITS
ncbi:MAG: GDP-mannose 4,6-dehydratase, partial [Endomicrobiia bacterium]|nr:GDP-mannose 4,6-dehydratase [Endomicrobiia bacterium]